MRCFHPGMIVRQSDWSGSNPRVYKRTIVEKIKKTYNTRDSLVVPYQSTDRAQGCLTSQFGWDAVLSPWYDRKTMSLSSCDTLVRNPDEKKKNLSDFFFFFLGKFFFFFFNEAGALLAFYFFFISSITTKC